MTTHIFKIKPELISIHFPKTAGSTFYSILRQNYRSKLKAIVRIQDKHKLNNGLEYRCNRPWIKAIHGHIQAHPYWKEQFPEAKVVSWVRDPVERLISGYYYQKQELLVKNEELYKLHPDLIEWAEMPRNFFAVNSIQTYLGYFKPEDYFFIGRTEHFNEDLHKLADKMNWKKIQYTNENVNRKKPQVSRPIKEKLRSLLKNEYELYEVLLKDKV